MSPAAELMRRRSPTMNRTLVGAMVIAVGAVALSACDGEEPPTTTISTSSATSTATSGGTGGTGGMATSSTTSGTGGAGGGMMNGAIGAPCDDKAQCENDACL